MSTEGTALEGLLQQEREAQEKAAARAANGESATDGNDSANGTDQQTDAPNALEALEAKVYAEIEKKKQASIAQKRDGNNGIPADQPKATD